MTNATHQPQQLGPGAGPPNQYLLAKAPSVKVDCLQPHQAMEPARPGNSGPPFAIERYLGEASNDGGATYALIHGSGRRDVLDVLVVVNAELGDVKVPT